MQNKETKVGRRNDKGCIIPARLVDNSAEISNVADLKFPMNWMQTHLRDQHRIENRLEMEGLFGWETLMLA